MEGDPKEKTGEPSRQEHPREQPRPSLTVDGVKEAVRRAAQGADELNQDLRDTFELNDSSATLRLR